MRDNGAAEDCLHLDLWAPPSGLVRAYRGCLPCRCAGAPVLVWIYGGGLLGGSKDYDDTEGRVYAEQGVLYVRANYRVGVLGFLQPEGGDANCGLWDMVEVLRWIQREIHKFGGDPNRVTIQGQSAGADVVYFLLCSPLANKLFHRAIVQSPASFTTTPAQAAELAREFAEVAGAKSSKLRDLQSLRAEEVLRAQTEGRFRVHPSTGPGWRVMCSLKGELAPLPLPDPSPAGLLRFPEGRAPQGYFFPTAVVDGELLLERPLDALAHGVAAHLEVIVGGNRDEDGTTPPALEGTQPLMPCYGVRLPTGEGRKQVVQRAAWEIAGMPKVLRATPEELMAAMERVACAYDEERRSDIFGLGPTGNAPTAEQWLLDTMISDISFLAAVHLISERLRRPSCCRRVYRYQFNGYGGRGDAFHAAEMPLLQGEEQQPMLRLPGALYTRRAWIASWAAFARSGDPNTWLLRARWHPYSHNARPVMFWDGCAGCQPDQGKMAKRAGLHAVAALWEDLWSLERPA